MNYRHVIKVENVTLSHKINSRELFTSLEIFNPDSNSTIMVNDYIEIKPKEWYRVINMPYVTITTDFSIASVNKSGKAILIKHFYVLNNEAQLQKYSN